MSIINVIVYSSGGDPDAVKSYFSDSRFNILNYHALVGTQDPKLNEFLWMKGALEYSKTQNPNRSCIIVKDTSFSNYPSAKIAEISLNAETVDELDVFYLTKWEDLCNLYRTASQFTYWCFSPRGNQCILYTPKGIDIVLGITAMPNGKVFECSGMWLEECLNGEIIQGNIKATSLFGNLLDFESIRYGQSNLSFNKLNECVFYTDGQTSGASPNIYLFVIGIVILILLIAWGLYKIGPKEVVGKKKTEKDKSDKGVQNVENDMDEGA